MGFGEGVVRKMSELSVAMNKTGAFEAGIVQTKQESLQRIRTQYSQRQQQQRRKKKYNDNFINSER